MPPHIMFTAIKLKKMETMKRARLYMKIILRRRTNLRVRYFKHNTTNH